MVPTLVAVASFLLCMGHRVASANITKTSPALFGISGYEWVALSSDSSRARFWISAKPGLSVTPTLYQPTSSIYASRYYPVPVVSAPGQEVHIQRSSSGHLQKMIVTVTYHPAPQISFNLSLRLTLTGSSSDTYYFRENLMVVPAYTKPMSSYNSLAMLKVLQVPPSEITPTELRINPPELIIRTLVEPYQFHIYIPNGIWYKPIYSNIKQNHTDAGVTRYSVDVSELNDTQLVGSYMVSLSSYSYNRETYEVCSALVNVQTTNSHAHGIFMLSSRPCDYYQFDGRDETPVHTWTAGVANCVCCDLRAEQTSTVSIWKEGQQLTWQQLSEGESLLEEEFGMFYRSVCLVVQEASERSAGSYTCHGQAGDGSTSTHSFTVAIRQPLN